MSLKFHHAVDPLQIWSAASDGISFVISRESRAGPGFRGRDGFIASWRPHPNGTAIRVIGAPFRTFEDAEAAGNTMLTYLATYTTRQ